MKFAIHTGPQNCTSPQKLIDRVGEYRRAGAEWIIMALRAPFDWESYELLVDRVRPAFR
jgi:hypothetical protein